MTTFTCSYEELKKIAVEFLKAAPTLDLDELENGLKCFHLHYLGCQYQNKAEEAMAPGLFHYVGKKYFDAEFALMMKA